MRPPTFNPFCEPRNAREGIIMMLADRPSMSYRELMGAVRRLGFPMSGQGFWKHLRILLQDGLIERCKFGEYRLSLKWIMSLRAFCEVAERSRHLDETGQEADSPGEAQA